MSLSFEKQKAEFEALKKLPPYERKMLRLQSQIDYETNKIHAELGKHMPMLTVIFLIMMVVANMNDMQWVLVASIIFLSFLLILAIWNIRRSRKSVKALMTMKMIEIIEESIE